MKYNVAYLKNFQTMYLSKDTFLIPYYLAKHKNLPLKVIYGTNLGENDLPTCYRGATLIGNPRKTISAKHEIYDWIRHIIPSAYKIDSLFFRGCSAHHMFMTWLIKTMNPKISVTVFGDMEEPQAQGIYEHGLVYGNGIRAFIKRKLVKYFFTHVKFTVANECAYRIMDKAYSKYGWKGLVSLYPCLDDELFYNLGLKFRNWKEKDNILLYVGRVGNKQKNTDMLLNALLKVDLKDWKVYLVGPITDSFEVGKASNYQDKINSFYERNPHQKGKVIFTGMIYDQNIIFDYYLRAKVFLLTSRHEGFANVLSQAAACGCYIISTDVGGAETVSNNWQFGIKIPQEDSDSLAIAIQSVIDGRTQIDESNKLTIDKFLYSSVIPSKLFDLK